MAATCPHCGATVWSPVCPDCHREVRGQSFQDKLQRLESFKPAFTTGDLASLEPVLREPELLEFSLLVATAVAPLPVIRFLLERGARVEASATGFDNPLVAAVDRGDLDVLRTFLGAQKWEKAAEAALHRAVKRNSPALLKELLSAKSWRGGGKDAFLTACDQNKLDLVTAMLEAGVDVNAADADGWTALFRGTKNDNLPLMKLLIAAGADVNRYEADGRDLLMLARRHGHREAEQLLLAAGAVPSVVIEERDKQRLRLYWRHLAEEWWTREGERMSSVVCDYCNRAMARRDGFLIGRKLACAPCVDSRLLGPEHFEKFRNDPSYYGTGVLQAAREFAAKQGI